MRLLDLAGELLYVISLRCSNFALARKCCSTSIGLSDSTTIVFPNDGAFRLSPIKVPRAWFRDEDGPEGCTFTSPNCSTDNSAAKRLRSTARITCNLYTKFKSGDGYDVP